MRLSFQKKNSTEGELNGRQDKEIDDFLSSWVTEQINKDGFIVSIIPYVLVFKRPPFWEV